MPTDTESFKDVIDRFNHEKASKNILARLLDFMLGLVDLQWGRIVNHTFPTRIVNQRESVKVTNYDQAKILSKIDGLVDALTPLLKSIAEKEVHFPTVQDVKGEVSVKGLGDLKPKPFPKFPEKIDVTHNKRIMELLKSIKVSLNSKDVKVSNLNDIKIPEITPAFTLEDKEELFNTLKSINFQFPEVPIPVALPDDFVQAVTPGPTPVAAPSFVNENGPARQRLDELSGYRPANRDASSSSPRYTGSVTADGKWYIMRETSAASVYTYEYAKGDSAYSTAWTNRASQSYDTFDNTF